MGSRSSSSSNSSTRGIVFSDFSRFPRRRPQTKGLVCLTFLPKLGQTNFSDASASFVCPFPLRHSSGDVGSEAKSCYKGWLLEETMFVF